MERRFTKEEWQTIIKEWEDCELSRKNSTSKGTSNSPHSITGEIKGRKRGKILPGLSVFQGTFTELKVFSNWR